MSMYVSASIVLLLVACNAAAAFGDVNLSDASRQYRTQPDRLASEYLKVEQRLWQRLNSDTEIRPNLLPEIYESHKNVLAQDFGDTGVMWELGIRLHEKIINNILAINGTASSLQAALENKHYDGALATAQTTVNQTVDAAQTLFQLTAQPSFWSHISVNVSHAACSKTTPTIPTEGQILFDVYSDIAAALLKSYISIQYSYLVLSIDEKENFKDKSEAYRHTFQQHYGALQSNVRALLTHADQRKWTCDTSSQLSTTHHQITRFIQGYVDNEINLNPDESCKATCFDYKKTRNFKCGADTLCADSIVGHSATRCNGTVHKCEFIDEDLTVCPSVSNLDSRRYDYIKYSGGTLFGKNAACPQPIQSQSWTSWFVKCSNCFCYCDEDSDLSDRFFSLRDVVTDVSQNRIVTGLSIIKRNRIIQLLVAESVLLPFGKINTTTATDEEGKSVPFYRLVSNEEFRITDANVRESSDYHKLSWENRAVDLDVVTAPANKVVTGVRFHLSNLWHLKLEIRATDFNFETGKLENIDGSVWIGSTPNEKSKISVEDQDIPTRLPEFSTPQWGQDQYVEFGPTDRVKDAAQLTVPFLDALMVQGKPCPLSGAGLYFKSKPGHSGYIAPVLIAHNAGSYITNIDV